MYLYGSYCCNCKSLNAKYKHLILCYIQSKKPKPAMPTYSSSKKLDTSSKKKSPSTGAGKKLTKKYQTHKRKSTTTVSVTENASVVNNLPEDTHTTSHSFVSEQVILPQESKQRNESSIKSATERNAEHKRALVEMKRLEKQQLEEERLLREKENLELQEQLEKQRQEQLQHKEKTHPADDVSFVESSKYKIKFPYVTPGQVSGLAALEREKILHKSLELSAVDETITERAAKREQEVEELLQKAKKAEAAFLANLREQERLQRIKEVYK